MISAPCSAFRPSSPGRRTKCSTTATGIFRTTPENRRPTICGTGLEDYICGSYNFDVGGKYVEFTTPYSGLHQVIRPDGLYQAVISFGM